MRLLLLHRAFVPESDGIPVGVRQLGPVAPGALAGRVRERRPPGRPFGESGIDVRDPEVQGTAVRLNGTGRLLQEDREVVAVPDGDRLAVGDLELDRQAERADVPATGALDVRDRNGEMVELHHGPGPQFSWP